MPPAIITTVDSRITLTTKLNVVAITGLISLITGFLVVFGWLFHVSILQTVIPGFVSMKFNTAVAFILLGSAMLIKQFPIKKTHQITSFVLCALIVSISLISVLQTVLHFDAGIDQLVVTDSTTISHHVLYPGRMSPITAACFVLTGCAFFGFTTRSTLAPIISQYLLNFVTAVSAVALIGYLYGLSEFYSLSNTGSIAIHTALLLFFISLTASRLQPSLGINSLFTGKQVGNIMARRVLLIGIFITCFFGLLSLIGKHFKLFSFNTGLSILIICFLCAGFVMLWNMARWMNKLDKGRSDAEVEVTMMNEQLELRVKQRSAKLVNLLAKYRESEARFKAAFEHSAIGIALVTLKGKWFQVNRSLCDMMGYKEQELLTLSFESAQGDNRLVQDEDDNNPADNNGRMERRYVCKDNSVVWIAVNTAAVVNKKGGAIYFVSQFEDITKGKTQNYILKQPTGILKII
jgi:PAS domain S-box-containing protein